MADETPQRSMSLIPYGPSESQEIVLRHRSAVVVYDERSKQLSLRDASRSGAVGHADCPYCHRPLREDSPEHERGETPTSPSADSGWMNPRYFRMLHHSTPASADSSRPPSPHRRLAQSIPRDVDTPALRSPPGAEFIGSSPVPPATPHGISSSAFSPNYFKSFFVEERELGRGGKGVVLLVRHVLDGVSLGHFACKRVPVGDDHGWLEKVLIEVQLLQNLSHQNLVSYRHVWLEEYKITAFGPSVPCAFILQQYCNAGDLHNYILNSAKSSLTTQQLKERMRRRSKGQAEPPSDLNGPRRMQFEEIFSFFKDITSGLNHLHTNGYIHRDLKPSNCLLHNTGQKTRVLVSDFGEVQVANAARRATGATGTISYCAPEVLRRDAPSGTLGNFSTKSDIFSLGMIVYFMCFGRSPYTNADDMHEENEDLEQLREEIAAWAGFDDERKLRADLPDKLYKFLKRLLSLDPNERPSTDEILHGIKAGSGLDDIGSFAHPAMFDDPRSRISSADSPAPTPHKHHNRKQSATAGFVRPGLSKLRPQSTESNRSPSPPVEGEAADGTASPLESSVVLRPRKVDMEPPSRQQHSPPLMLPPPPPALPSRAHRYFADPMGAGVARVALFLLKYLSLSSPCAPFASNPWITYPLLVVAALDFAFLGSGRGVERAGVGASLALLGVHVLVIAASVRLGKLCPRKVAVWEGD